MNSTACISSEKAMACPVSTFQSRSMDTAANSKVPMAMGRPGTVLLKNTIPSVMTIMAGTPRPMPVALATIQPASPTSTAWATDITKARPDRHLSRLIRTTADANWGTTSMRDRNFTCLSAGPTVNSSIRLKLPKTTPAVR